MTLRVVADASALVAMLIDSGSDGRWATDALSGAEIAAPDLLPFEAANIIRRQELAGTIGSDQAAQAHADLRQLTIESWPYELLAVRAFELRANLSIYDASYVALAELIDANLITLDRRIAGAPGLRCALSMPPESDAKAMSMRSELD